MCTQSYGEAVIVARWLISRGIMLFILIFGVLEESASGTRLALMVSLVAALFAATLLKPFKRLSHFIAFFEIACLVALESASQFAVNPYFPMAYFYLIFETAFGGSVSPWIPMTKRVSSSSRSEASGNLSMIWIAALVLGASIKYLEILRRDPTFLVPGSALLSLALLAAVGIALRYAQIYRKERDELARLTLEIEALSTSKEQKRISRELHDTLGHALTGHIMRLELIDHYLVESQPETAMTQLSSAKEEGRGMLRTVQEIVTTLREPAWETQDLEILVERHRMEGPPEPHLTITGDLSLLTPPSAHAFYRAVQEGLTNARRHSGASHIEIEIKIEPNTGAQLYIEDDGSCGSGSIVPGNGLKGMRERIEALGGNLKTAQGSRGGLAIEIELPPFAGVSSPVLPVESLETGAPGRLMTKEKRNL
jgi:signal transduction histidine kinase